MGSEILTFVALSRVLTLISGITVSPTAILYVSFLSSLQSKLGKFDSKEIEFSDFLSRYFFEDGSFSSSYSAFVNGVIKPFRDSLNAIMESVIEGKLQDPIEAFCEAEKKKEEEKQKRLIEEEKNRELERRQNGENIKQIKEILLKDKLKVKEKKLAEKVEYEILLIIDMLANVVESNDKDAIVYALLLISIW